MSQKILEVYQKCSVHEFPVDCTHLLECYGYRVRTYGSILSCLPEAAALAKKFSNDSFTDMENRIVLYNERVNRGRARFSQAHELGHIVYEHVGRNKEMENEADVFASHLLAPRAIVFSEGLKTADEIHNYFDISYAAANYVVSDIKKRKPNSIDSQIIRYFSAPSTPSPERFELNQFITALENSNPNLVLLKAQYFI